jgi:hypothetical protein
VAPFVLSLSKDHEYVRPAKRRLSRPRPADEPKPEPALSARRHDDEQRSAHPEALEGRAGAQRLAHANQEGTPMTTIPFVLSPSKDHQCVRTAQRTLSRPRLADESKCEPTLSARPR